ncbi:glycoside hydrolase family 10 protein [Tulasnella calospora MUT 4182]|uniref:Glycoside hydrolase family 10 protein n=1 Tax=Tulasnella calospora MUT 4182 TaxID=1051891 RepID=A0A0C3Q445_9AGAM|nr:glycoside hydrolase family 10 protein [Tulasnella calospora MUT 4182]
MSPPHPTHEEAPGNTGMFIKKGSPCAARGSSFQGSGMGQEETLFRLASTISGRGHFEGTTRSEKSYGIK